MTNRVICLLAGVLLLLPACDKTPSTVAVTSVSVSPSSVTLTEGESKALSATVSPSDATDKSVSWTSSAPDVASVTSSGNVTAIKAGSATITVKTTDGGKTATCAVTVNAKVFPVTGVTLDAKTKELVEGESFTLKATVAPDNATDKSVTWTSSAPEVATVDANGKVTAVKAGSATITVKTTDGGKTATCAVTVKPKVYPATGVSLDKTAATLYEGETETLTATVAPDNATDKSVTWTSSAPEVATVDATGKVTAVKAGTATITVTTTDGGKTATCTITVKAHVSGVSLDKTAATLFEGETETLIATVAPDNATDKSVTWSSSAADVATVDANGKVTAVKAGAATITVTTTDGGKTATCEVTVKAHVASVSLNKTTLTLTAGGSETLTATVAPDNAADKSVTWSSSAPEVATVDENGKVTAVKAGTATITVTTTDGGKTATCTVTVQAATGGNEGYGPGGEYGEGNF